MRQFRGRVFRAEHTEMLHCGGERPVGFRLTAQLS